LPQSLLLLKKLPDPDYLHNLQAEGVFRASMNFLPGGCWEGAALYDASPSYAMSATTGGTRADSGCPDPSDTVGCLLWELIDTVRKVSNTVPSDFNAFAFVEVSPGAGSEFLDIVEQAGSGMDGPGEYVAAGRLIGCGTYNTVVEVLSNDHDRMLQILDRITDVAIVRQYSVGRLAAQDARGFGSGETAGVGG
jgi:hypothetical protein